MREEEPAGEVDAGEEAFQPTFLRVRVRGGATRRTVRVAGVASRRRRRDADEFCGADAVHRVSADGAQGHALLREDEVVSRDEATGTEEGDAASDLSRAAGGGVSVGYCGDDARALPSSYSVRSSATTRPRPAGDSSCEILRMRQRDLSPDPATT